MKHIGLKIIACIFGIALWFYVVSARVTEIDIQVPLVFTRLPETLAIASRPAQKITITVKGTAIDLIRLKRSSESAAKILVDLHDAELGLERIILSEDNFIAPDFPNIHYQSANQIAALEVEIDTRISRTIPVHLKGAFDAKDGYTIIGVPTPDPDTISISGAREALTRIFEIQTEEIKKQNLEADETFNVPLDFSKLPPYVFPSDSFAMVPVSVQPLVRKSFTGVPVQLIGLYDRSQYLLEPSIATVEVSGGQGVLSDIKKKDILLFIEFNRFAIEDADSLEPTVRISSDVKSFQVRPEKFYLKKKVPVVPEADPANDSTKASPSAPADSQKTVLTENAK
ncbi:MAG: CdaR family protein [Hallerella succinigenes]|uniref:CdaR family protein n=1 Tax=Hallerella succinigenes TaxID=1896222 RepID=UPI0023F50AD7|nr:CdaR family protein [Hallerella succinigenes]MDD6092650.1 CdaR family protein [Hallerella succinigenes]